MVRSGAGSQRWYFMAKDIFKITIERVLFQNVSGVHLLLTISAFMLLQVSYPEYTQPILITSTCSFAE
jgi:hypothetical protein